MFTGLCGVHAGRLVIDSGKTVDRLQAECAHTCHGDALDGQIVRLGAAGSEDHVVRAGAETGGERGAGGIKRPRRRLAGLMHACRVRVCVGHERHHRLDDVPGHRLGGSGVQIQLVGFAGCIGSVSHG